MEDAVKLAGMVCSGKVISQQELNRKRREKRHAETEQAGSDPEGDRGI